MRAFLNIFPTNNLGVLYNFIHGLAPCWRWNFWLFYDREIASEIIVISFTTEFKHDYISVPRLQIMLYQHIQIYYAVVCLHSKYVFMSSTFFICFLLTYSYLFLLLVGSYKVRPVARMNLQWLQQSFYRKYWILLIKIIQASNIENSIILEPYI